MAEARAEHVSGVWLLYCHVFPNGKRYVGVTSNPDPVKRWGKSGAGYFNGNQPLMERAIRKYGWDNVQHVILLGGIRSKEEAVRKEHEYILEFRTNEKEFGYNIRSGGEGVNGISADTRRKLSESRKRYYAAHPEKRVPFFAGKKHTEEQKRKCSETMKEYCLLHPERAQRHSQQMKQIKHPSGYKLPNKWKKVICLESGVVFQSVSEAAEKMKVNVNSLSHCLHGKYKTAGRYHWRFA